MFLVAYTASVSVVMYHMVANMGRHIAGSILTTTNAVKTTITEVIPEIIMETIPEMILDGVNKTLVLRNQAVHLVTYVGAGALVVLNNVKDLVLYIVGGAVQEVVKVAHLIVHIGVQGFYLVRSAYRFIFSGMEAVYTVLATVNTGIQYTTNGVYYIVDTTLQTPQRLYNFTVYTLDLTNQTITNFIDETVYPTVDWFLYGPKINNTKYYMFLITLLVLCSIYNWYRNSKYSSRQKYTKQEILNPEEAAEKKEKAE